jgi:Fic family protein
MQYNPLFVAHRPILDEEDKNFLRALSEQYTLNQFRADPRNYEEVMVDFVYTSAKIEGNTYDRIDTDNLLRIGVTAGGKRFSDAVMLVNLREGFSRVIESGPETLLDFDYLCDLHKVLMKDLLPIREPGIGRTIGATSYRPLADPNQLRTEIKFMLPEADKYADPFEQAIYLHCNLAYLQFFKDGNKRTARMMQTAALARAGVLPLFFHESLIDQYRRATVNYYETGDYAPYVAFFKENYRIALENMLGTDNILDRTLRRLKEVVEFHTAASNAAAVQVMAPSGATSGIGGAETRPKGPK